MSPIGSGKDCNSLGCLTCQTWAAIILVDCREEWAESLSQGAAVANYRFPGSEPADEGGTLTRRAYESLRSEILSGQFAPGDRLVRRALSKRLGVSPMPVTEALHMLETDGLVESRPLYGCRVRPLTIEDLGNDQVLREALECQAARLVAERASDDALKRLAVDARQLDRLMEGGDPDSKLGMELHLEFHVKIARLSGYARLSEELHRVWSRLLMRVNWIKATRYKPVPEDWHQQLVHLLQGRDPASAESKMREHVQFGNEDDHAALKEHMQERVGHVGRVGKITSVFQP
jgi:DNA-binding GntR family transcriptional regulator